MKNTPTLRFRGFIDEWEEYELDNIIEISKNKYNPLKCEETYKCIELENISQGTGQLLGFFSSKDQQSVKNKFNTGQVLFGKLRPYLRKYWLAEFEGVCSSEIWVLEGKKVLNQFLYYIIQTNQFNFISNISSGSKMPRADWSYMSEYPFYIPSLEEQEKIASFFSLIDKKIELQTKKVEELKNYKKGIMQKIFSQELRFKDENGNDYPEWEKRKLQDVVERKIKGKNPVYSEIGNVLLNNEFMENNTQPLFVENEIDVTKKDILILWDGSQAGKVYTGFEGVLGSTFVAITLNQNNCNIFMQEQLEYNLDKIQRAWREGSGVPHVAKDFIENYKVFVPCYEEQNKVSKVLLNINEKINLENKKLQYTKELKKGLLQQMFI